MKRAGGYSPNQQSNRAKRGGEGEDHASRLHEACRAAGVADMQRIPTEMRIVGTGPGGTLLCRPAKGQRSPIDFLGGMLDGSGRAVACEVKRFTQDDGPFPTSRVERHQVLALDRAVAAGWVTVVLIIGDHKKWVVPWALLREKLSWSESDLAPFIIRVDEPDYLRRFVRV